MKKLLMLLITLMGTGPLLHAGVPCCSVMSVNMKKGIVIAQERATGRMFTFQASAAVLRGLHVGSAVYANFSRKQISLNGRTPCCVIGSIPSRPVAASGSVSCDPNLCACHGDKCSEDVLKNHKEADGSNSCDPNNVHCNQAQGADHMCVCGTP